MFLNRLILLSASSSSNQEAIREQEIHQLMNFVATVHEVGVFCVLLCFLELTLAEHNLLVLGRQSLWCSCPAESLVRILSPHNGPDFRQGQSEGFHLIFDIYHMLLSHVWIHKRKRQCNLSFHLLLMQCHSLQCYSLLFQAVALVFKLLSSPNQLIRIPALKMFGFYLQRSTLKYVGCLELWNLSCLLFSRLLTELPFAAFQIYHKVPHVQLSHFQNFVNAVLACAT